MLYSIVQEPSIDRRLHVVQNLAKFLLDDIF